MTSGMSGASAGKLESPLKGGGVGGNPEPKFN